MWKQRENGWWLTDFTALADTGKLHKRALPGCWQTAPYETREFSGVMLLANPSAAAPEVRIPLPVRGRRYAISIGLVVNYCDRLLVKLEGDPCFTKLAHGPAEASANTIEECWWKDADLRGGEVLLLQQDAAMRRRSGVAFVRLEPAPEPTRPEIPLIATADGLPGNHGPISLDEMMAEELQFAGTHVTELCHGTDINGLAEYMTELGGSHRYPVERAAEEKFPDDEYYLWTVQQLMKYERQGRCPLRDSIAAAHSIGLKIYAYHRMAITRLYAPFRSLFENPLYDAHPEWRCVDLDGTPISRLSIAYPEVRQYLIEHLRETISFGTDGLCLVFARGWPLVLFEKPVQDEFRRRTGCPIPAAGPSDPELRRIQTEVVSGFLREVRQAATEAARGRPVRILAIVLAQPEFNLQFGFDCRAWSAENLVQTLIPYPYGPEAQPAPIRIPEWLAVVQGTSTQLCPILNRMTYEPAGIYETPMGLLDRSEAWLREGVDGFAFWDLDGNLALPAFRRLACNLGSREGRARLRASFATGPVRHALKTFDGLAVDRYHPGWNV